MTIETANGLVFCLTKDPDLRSISAGSGQTLYGEKNGDAFWSGTCFSQSLPVSLTWITSKQTLFTVRLSYVHHTYGPLCRRLRCSLPWALLETLTVPEVWLDNKKEIVTIFPSCQKNISNTGYKQRSLISEGPRLVGPVGASQGNMKK